VPIPDLTDRALGKLFRLDGRVAVVTGGALGIGAAICRRYAEAGATVIVADVNEAAGRESAARLTAVGATSESVVVDVRDSPSVDALADGVVARHGKIDVWVNNAGIYPNKEFLELTDADWDRVVEINLRGAFAGSRAAARHMVPRGEGGAIINLSSINGYRAFGPGIAHYTTTKHALRGLTKSLAVELGPHNIRVLALAPTMVETEGVAELRNEVDESEFGAAMAALAATHPLRRVALPDDVARVALFCASDLAAMMTGSTVVVDGGYLAL
jgi:NAD(P)-dependent dehydrogenase (short-subunit alcohol dehydrogenase family)